MFLYWITTLIEKNARLANISLRIAADEGSPLIPIEKNKLSINQEQAHTIMDELKANTN